MKKLALILIGTLLVSATAAKGVDRRLDADPKGRVSVSNVAGSIEIIGWKNKEVEVKGTIGKDVEELVFERDGKHTWIKVRIKERHWGNKDVSADLVIRVPMGSSIDVGTVSADIDVEDVRGEQELHAVSGDIETDGVAADIQAETVSGDVDVNGTDKDIEADLSSVSGDITVTDVSGEIEAEVVSGDIEISYGAFDRVKLETVNGDVDYNAGLRKSAKMDVETVNGRVDIDFIGAVSARFDIETFNGRIKNCFGPKAERTSRHAPGWELVFTEGKGDGRVTIETLNGGLDLCKE